MACLNPKRLISNKSKPFSCEVVLLKCYLYICFFEMNGESKVLHLEAECIRSQIFDTDCQSIVIPMVDTIYFRTRY